jgi:hypothetical protein
VLLRNRTLDEENMAAVGADNGNRQTAIKRLRDTSGALCAFKLYRAYICKFDHCPRFSRHRCASLYQVIRRPSIPFIYSIFRIKATKSEYNLSMSGKENLDNLMRKVIKVSPEELKQRLEAEKLAKKPAKVHSKKAN